MTGVKTARPHVLTFAALHFMLVRLALIELYLAHLLLSGASLSFVVRDRGSPDVEPQRFGIRPSLPVFCTASQTSLYACPYPHCRSVAPALLSSPALPPSPDSAWPPRLGHVTPRRSCAVVVYHSLAGLAADRTRCHWHLSNRHTHALCDLVRL